MDWKPGDIVRNIYPFVRTTYSHWDVDGVSEVASWRPGIEHVMTGPYGDADAFYDAFGEQVLEVIDVHKPGKYPIRVFYVCRWIDPDGKAFGKGKLRITTVPAFSRRASGFMSHDSSFEMFERKS